jgi:hypothetical protein
MQAGVIDIDDAVEFVRSEGYMVIDTHAPDFADLTRFLEQRNFLCDNVVAGVTPKLLAFFEKSNYTCVKMVEYSMHVEQSSKLHLPDVFSYATIFFSTLFVFMCYKIATVVYNILN